MAGPSQANVLNGKLFANQILWGSWVLVTVAVLLMAGFLAWKRNWYWLICLSLTVPFGMLLNVLMKYSFHRIRPSFENPLLVVSSYSFPSGHVAMLVARLAAWRWRVMVVLAALAMVLLVALTRMYLGVHYLSDVLAAFAEGVAWLALCLTGMNTFWHHRAGAEAARKKTMNP